MDNETHEYIKTLNRKTLVEIIDSLSFAAGFEIHHGDDPADEGHTVYGVHAEDGSFTIAHIDQSSFEETTSSNPVPKLEMGEARFVCNNNMKPTDNGCGCMQDPPCIGCAPAKPPAPEVQMEPMNCLSLFKVYTIDSDLCESDPIFVMARTEDGAACLFHKARARDFDNILCEVIVSKVQDAEVCDE